MKRRLPWLAAAALLASVAASAYLLRSSHEKNKPDEPQVLVATPGLPWFEDATLAAGIDFAFFDPATANQSIQETMCGGVAWIDYDNDGWLDLLCVQTGPVVPVQHKGPLPTHCLYRNLGNGKFRDVTKEVGLDRSGFGFGAAVGDFDNDGFDDLAITYVDRTELWHNVPDGKGGRRFEDVSKKAGIDNPHWATSCAWGDIDGDGFLDLYLCNYVELDPAYPLICRDPQTGVVQSCSPTAYPHTTHRLYRNQGNGTFSDISKTSGVASATPAPGLGVAMVDLDGDGLLDIFVANDMRPSYLFHNQGSGKFVEKAVYQGCAYGYNGGQIAGMGVAVGDFDDSGRPSLFVTNFQNEPNVLFLNRGKLRFDEASYSAGLALPSLPRLGFGTALLDADLDARPDIAVVNGHVYRNVKQLTGAPYEQEAQLFLNEGKGKYRDISAKAGSYFHRKLVGRGLARADYDNDGLPDLAIGNNGGPMILLRNATQTKNRWLRLELVGDGKKSNRNAIGAVVEVEVKGVRTVHWIVGGGSYLSANERRLSLGLGQADRADRVQVTWPSGKKQTFDNLAAQRAFRLTEGNIVAEEVKLPNIQNP